MIALAASLVSGIADLLVPPLCVVCAAETADGSGLGAGCGSRLVRLDGSGPRCVRCGLPNAVPFPGGRCADCTVRRPAFSAASSAALYGGTARVLLLAFKLGGDRAACTVLVDLLETASRALPRAADAVVPVPARRRPVGSRRPVEELARALSERLGLPLRARWLQRVREAAPQGSPTTLSRRANVRDAFAPRRALLSRAPRSPRGLRLLLVDDVLTSGSTAHECARALRRAGAREVLVATVARGGLGPGACLAGAARDGGPSPPGL